MAHDIIIDAVTVVSEQKKNEPDFQYEARKMPNKTLQLVKNVSNNENATRLHFSAAKQIAPDSEELSCSSRDRNEVGSKLLSRSK
jgi:hypothetical protein